MQTIIEREDHLRASPSDPATARQKLLSATRLHWFHWIIILLSLTVCIAAWRFSVAAVDAQVQERFDRECDQVIELVQERMKNYEDALWGGVSMTHAAGGDVSFEHWQAYAQSLNIENKYPGINGIGLIHALSPDQLPDYLVEQRELRPDYHIHPSHTRREYYPISYIVPVKGNEKAVGLDMAHENNRYTAAIKSRDSGKARITGPITLVQDNDKTAGFLFFAPLYRNGTHPDQQTRQNNFTGLVYAPFVVKKLLRGTLEKEKRQVGLRLLDESNVLYDEHVASEIDYDPNPLFKRSVEVPIYGRVWEFDVWSTNSFRESSNTTQPLFILLGGILIDGLLILLFVLISRSSKKALNYADSMTHELTLKTKQLEQSKTLIAERAKQLERSNEELEQFAYVASHDLQEPLRKVASFCALLKQDYGHALDSDGQLYVDYAVDGAKRMRTVIQDLLEYSKTGNSTNASPSADTQNSVAAAKQNLATAIEESGASITHDPLPKVSASESGMSQLFQNLIGNAIKYRKDQPPEIHIGVASQGDDWLFSVSDNGIGISPEFHDQVFGIFKRLHSKTEYEGTGIGLAICKRIVERVNGKIWIAPKQGPGCKICFTIPKHETTIQSPESRELEPITA